MKIAVYSKMPLPWNASYGFQSSELVSLYNYSFSLLDIFNILSVFS